MHNWLDICRHQVSTSLRARRDTLDTSGQATPLPILKAQIEGDNRNRGCWQKSYKWWQVRKTRAACTRLGTTWVNSQWWQLVTIEKGPLRTCNAVGVNSNLIIIRTEVVAYGPEDGKGKACKSDLCREETWILIVIWASDGERASERHHTCGQSLKSGRCLEAANSTWCSAMWGCCPIKQDWSSRACHWPLGMCKHILKVCFMTEEKCIRILF